MKNLENYGVQELNAMEIRKTDGGLSTLQPNLFWHFISNEIVDFIDGFNDYNQ